MWRAIRRAAVAGASCVSCVSAVPAFAQSNNAAGFAREQASLTAAREYVPTASFDAARTIPPNLLIPHVYRPLIESMLRHSPTFARQCQRIANAPQLTVALTLGSSPTSGVSRMARARTRIVREGNRLLAHVTLGRTSDAMELIAHEIEHVIEQLDEVDLAAKAGMPDSGVHALHHDGIVFETIRAQRVGRRVAEEVRRPLPRHGWFGR